MRRVVWNLDMPLSGVDTWKRESLFCFAVDGEKGLLD